MDATAPSTDIAEGWEAPLPGTVDRIDPDDWADVWIVGDVHGCADALAALLERIDPGPETLCVFVGDLVRKGPESARVCRMVADRENLVSVRGNNEQKIVEGRASATGLGEEWHSFLESLPVAIAIGEDVVVHGGLDHRKPLGDHTVTDLLTCRSFGEDNGYERPYWFERRQRTPRVFFGHTVLARPFRTPWAVGLDTGCVYGGALTAVNRASGEVVSVPARETHQERSEDSIVDPRQPRRTER